MKLAAFLLLMLAAAPAGALDKDRLAQHLRENLSLDARTEIVVTGDPVPAGIGSLEKVSVTVGGAPYDVLITTDGSRYVWGLAADLSTSPDATRAAAISLKNVHAVGAKNAPVTVVEYSDLQCSYCRKAHEMLAENLHKAYTPAQVRWVFKHFPLNMHAWAMPAAMVVECAARQDEEAFWKMTGFYFENQDKVTEKNVTDMGLAEAARIGLKRPAIDACLDDPKVRARINADKAEGSRAGVSSTPTLFINGRLRRGFRDFEDVRVVIDEKLKAARKK